MKYKHIFLIWFWADVLLGFGFILFSIVKLILYSPHNIEISSLVGSTIVFGVMGVLYSLPSLLTMLGFHFIYDKYLRNSMNHIVYYLLVILFINSCYVLVGKFAPEKYQPIYILYEYSRYWYYIFIPTTLAGLLSFFLVTRKISMVSKSNDE